MALQKLSSLALVILVCACGSAGAGGGFADSGTGALAGSGGWPGAGGSSAGGTSAGGVGGETSGGAAGTGTGGATPSGVPAHIELVSGNGAALLENWPGGEAKVKITDYAGDPVPNVDVTWSLVSGEGVNITSPGQPVSQTDDKGIASRMLQGTGFSPSVAFGQGIVRATSTVGTVDFVAVTVHGTSAGPIGPWILLVEPTSFDLGEVKAGSVLPKMAKLEAAIQAGVFSGTPLPNVGLRFVDGNDHTQPAAASCVGGSVLTDSAGHAECDLQIGTELGPHWISALGGETSVFTAIHYDVVP